jgi:hypothetical protein
MNPENLQTLFSQEDHFQCCTFGRSATSPLTHNCLFEPHLHQLAFNNHHVWQQFWQSLVHYQFLIVQKMGHFANKSGLAPLLATGVRGYAIG